MYIIAQWFFCSGVCCIWFNGVEQQNLNSKEVLLFYIYDYGNI